QSLFSYYLAWLNVSDATTGGTGALSSWGLQASSSDDGHRMVFDFYQVIDDQFQIVGHLQYPDYSAPVDTAMPLAGVASPDGTRAYVLTARASELSRPPTGHLPRVYVFDISGDVGASAVPVLGYFEIPDYPSCIDDLQTCGLVLPAAISLDGATLYF